MAHSPRKLLVNNTSRTIVCGKLAIADRVVSRARGLLGRRAMHRGEGLLLRPAPAIHTGFMRFDIDVVFLDAQLRTIKLVPEMKPWRAVAARRAHAALELEAGAIGRLGIRLGDRFSVLDLHVPRDSETGVSNVAR